MASRIASRCGAAHTRYPSAPAAVISSKRRGRSSTVSTPTGSTETPSDAAAGSKSFMTSCQWLGRSVFARTPILPTRGAISFNVSSCFPVTLNMPEPGHVAARPRQAGDEALSDRVSHVHHDRDRRSGPVGRHGGVRYGDDDIDLLRDKGG